MPVYQFGAAVPQAPGLDVFIVPPQNIAINGIATNILGIVGVGSWGPVNAPMVIGDAASSDANLGAPLVRSHDLATAIKFVALQEGVTAIAAVRVTDGTDAAATVQIMDTASTPEAGLTLTAKYTGTVGNAITAAVSAGTANGSFKLTIQRAGYTPEVFDNLTGSGAALWAAMANAVNNGQNGVRGPSGIVTAAADASTAAPNTTATYTLAGGMDGASGVTDTILIGADGITRTGMYALRGSFASNLCLLDHATSTNWPAILAFATEIGAYGHVAPAASTSAANTATALSTAGVDGYGLKVLVGDWAYIYDSQNGVQRMISPATVSAAKAASLIPAQGNLNQRCGSVIGTQRSATQIPYSDAEIAAVYADRLDVIANNSPGGQYFSCRTGINCASNAIERDDTFTKMNNYLAFSLAGTALGAVVGKPQTASLRLEAKTAVDDFLLGTYQQGWIGDPDNPKASGAFATVCNTSNNPSSRVVLGYMQLDATVKLFNTVRFFNVNLQANGAVSVSSGQAS